MEASPSWPKENQDDGICSLCTQRKELQTQTYHKLLGLLKLCGPCSLVLDLARVGARTEANSPAEQIFVQHIGSTVEVLSCACAALEGSKGLSTGDTASELQLSTQVYP